jgi:hypothetical protein
VGDGGGVADLSDGCSVRPSFDGLIDGTCEGERERVGGGGEPG